MITGRWARRRFAIMVALSMTNCATFNISVGRDTNRNNTRQEVAGTTLACAGSSQRSSLYALVVSAVAGSTSGLLASAATNAAARPTESSGLAVASIAASVVSLVANVAAWVFLGNSIAYTERAGLVLAGLSNDGCNESGELPRVWASEPAPAPATPVQRKPAPSSDTSAIGKCSTSEVAEMKKSGLSDSAVERACAP